MTSFYGELFIGCDQEHTFLSDFINKFIGNEYNLKLHYVNVLVNSDELH